jgi:D-threo-aldose 1-dehydrogenase
MYDQAPSNIVEKTRRMASICNAYNVSLAAVALQFPLAHPAVAAVIPGAKSRQEAEQNRDYLTSPVPTNVWHELKDEGLLDPNAPTPDR